MILIDDTNSPDRLNDLTAPDGLRQKRQAGVLHHPGKPNHNVKGSYIMATQDFTDSQKVENLRARIDEAAALIGAIHQAHIDADQDSGNVSRTTNWLVLIGAASDKAYRVLTGESIDSEGGAL